MHTHTHTLHSPVEQLLFHFFNQWKDQSKKRACNISVALLVPSWPNHHSFQINNIMKNHIINKFNSLFWILFAFYFKLFVWITCMKNIHLIIYTLVLFVFVNKLIFYWLKIIFSCAFFIILWIMIFFNIMITWSNWHWISAKQWWKNNQNLSKWVVFFIIFPCTILHLYP